MTTLEAVTGAWGLLPLAVPAVIFAAWRIGGRVFPNQVGHRALGGAILAVAFILVGVRLLGALRLFTPVAAATVLLVLTVTAVFLRPIRKAAPLEGWREGAEALPLALVGVGALLIGLVAARWLPIWHWDALGYHLPYVNLFLQGRGPAGVPNDIPFLSTYPHAVELFTIAWRAVLPDDRLVDAAQIPLGVLGAMAIAGIARLHGAARIPAVAAGCAWFAVPAVLLQLPSNYVDVGSAAFLLTAIYFVLAPPTSRTALVAGVALGLFLGSKPSAPVTTAVLALVLLVRGHRTSVPARALVVALLLIPLLGGESYVTNLVQHGNPGWPVAVDVGPLHLPGTMRLDKVVVGPSPELSPLRGSLVWRLVESWITLDAPPVFDMRIGGYGLLFLFAVPLAIAAVVRTRSLALAAAIVAVFLNPCPTWARFVLAFPGIALALAVTYASRLPKRVGAVVFAAAAIVAVFQIRYAWPGLAYEKPLHGFPYHGPPLLAYAGMTDEQRERAVSADGPPEPFIDVRKRVRDGEAYAIEARRRDHEGEPYAFNLGDVLPYLAWDNFRYPVIVLPDIPDAQLNDYLEREHVRIFAADNESPLAHWAEAHPNQFVRLFSYRLVPCAVYERL